MLQVLEQKIEKKCRYKQMKKKKKQGGVGWRGRHKQLKKHLGNILLPFPLNSVKQLSCSLTCLNFLWFCCMSWLLWQGKKWCRWLESVCNDIFFFCHTLFLTHFPTLIHSSCLFPLLQHRSHGCSP